MGDNLYVDKDRFADFLLDINNLNLRKMTHDQVRLMFEVLLYGSMRISEVLQITPNDLIDGKIRLRITKGGVERCKCAKWEWRPTRLVKVNKNCKKCLGNGKYRIDSFAWVKPSIYEKLQDHAKKYKPDERLFPITRSWAWHYANELLNARTHTFRHTFLTWMLESGKMDIRDIKQKARHKSLAVTSKYIEENIDLTIKKENEAFEDWF